MGKTPVRVRYAETDQMRVVYHANYFIWFEIGRVELMRQLGLEYSEMEAEGCGIAVVEARIRYKLPARYDDELVIETRLAKVRGPIIQFAYRIMREPNQVLLCEGDTVHILVGPDMKRRHMPKKYADLLGAAASDTMA